MFRAVFDLGGSFGSSQADQEVGRKALAYMLRALFLIDCAYLRSNPNTPWLYESGVRYQREAPPREVWQDIVTTQLALAGDCEDLACWRAAELSVRKNMLAEPVFIWSPTKRGNLYHIQVRTPTGIEDPSKVLGM